MSVNNKPSVVNQAIVVDALEDIGVNVSVATGYKDSSFELKFVLLSALLLFVLPFLGLRLVLFIIIATHTAISIAAFLFASVLVLIFVLFLLIVDLVKLLEEKTLKVSITLDFNMLIFFKTFSKLTTLLWLWLVLVSDDLHELDLLVNGDSHFFEHQLDLLLDILVIESIGVDYWQILLHDLVGLVVLFDMVACFRDGKNDTLGSYAAIEKSLNEGIRVESAAINDTIRGSPPVCESFH